MQQPEEQKQSLGRDIVEGIDAGGTVIEIAVDGIFAVGEFLGDAAGGVLDGISIDI